MTNIVVAVSSLSVRGYWLETSEQGGIGYLELSRREGGLFPIWYNYKQGILCKRHIDQLLEATDNPTSCPDRILWDEDSEPVPDHEPSTMTKYSHIYFKTLHTKAGVQVYLFLRPPKKKTFSFPPTYICIISLTSGGIFTNMFNSNALSGYHIELYSKSKISKFSATIHIQFNI